LLLGARPRRTHHAAIRAAAAVIVNDISVAKVDARLVKIGSASLARVVERLVEMQNG
jgi:G3E family GTPase